MRLTLAATGLTVLGSLLSIVAAQFNPSASNNVAVYWGQGPDQRNLIETCKSSAYDIVVVGFVNVFPDQGPGGYPGTNFGNQCGDGRTYIVNGVSTKLLSNCPAIGPDIIACQNLGKKVLLSLGGGWPLDYYIKTDASARSFADFLWGAFGPQSSSWTGPRPFGAAAVDGFDFDIESSGIDGQPGVPADYKYGRYGTMINYMRNTLYPTGPKTYYISGAPQCILPDEHLAAAMSESWFDFVFVQFYNTPFCSARAGVNKLTAAPQDPTWDITMDGWADFVSTSSVNKNAKIYIGLVCASCRIRNGSCRS